MDRSRLSGCKLFHSVVTQHMRTVPSDKVYSMECSARKARAEGRGNCSGLDVQASPFATYHGTLPGVIVLRLGHTQAVVWSTPGGPGAGHNARWRATAHLAASLAFHRAWDDSERVPSRVDPAVHRGASAAVPA